VVLNRPVGDNDIAATTNADILATILDVPLLPGLGPEIAKIPLEWSGFWGSSG
jgi:hypothetical protein